MAVVELQNITKNYEASDIPAVDNIDLKIEDGEFMVLLGPSGCGKSTTLRMIAGLETITSGSLTIDDREMNNVPAKDRDISMVFQSYALYPHMTVRNNLAFGLRRRKIDRAEIDRRVENASETLGLTELLDRKPYSLSGGQRQRVALGRAIVRDPKVFLFDEPLSNLDAALRVHTRSELIKQHQALGTTMIYVTHDQVEAMTMGTRICIMNEGKIVQVGSPLEVYLNPVDTFVASFLGSPPANLINGEATAKNKGVQVNALGVDMLLADFAEETLKPLTGPQIIFGVRPEDIYTAIPSSATDGQFSEISAKAIAVEPLGAETLIVFSVGGEQEIMARLGRNIDIKPGDECRLYIDLATIYLFDPNTKRALPKSS